jgi:hypothetical protein
VVAAGSITACDRNLPLIRLVTSALLGMFSATCVALDPIDEASTSIPLSLCSLVFASSEIGEENERTFPVFAIC